jgi:hypothetical protein
MNMKKIETMFARSGLVVSMVAVALLAAGCARKTDEATPAAAQGFDTPEAVVAALVATLQKNDLAAAAKLLGPGSEDLLSSGDAVADKADYYKLLQIFSGIIHATRKKHNSRLTETLLEMQKAIGVEINWENLAMKAADAGALDWTISKWRKNSALHDDLLKKFVQSQLSFSSFPFAGIGNNIIEKTKLLIFRFAITKLALMSLPEDADEATIIRSIQSISRILDHLGDATLTLNLFEESGWNNDARICGLIAD